MANQGKEDASQHGSSEHEQAGSSSLQESGPLTNDLISVEGLKHAIEALPIEDGYRSISKLAYGKNGFVNFLNRIFYNTSEDERKQFNYYFALKSHLMYLQNYEKVEHPSEEVKEECSSPTPKGL